MVIDAARQEGENPSFDDLPPDGSLVERHRVDDTGQRRVEFFGRESFIKGLGREAQKIVRVMNPRDGSNLFGPPFEQAPRRRMG